VPTTLTMERLLPRLRVAPLLRVCRRRRPALTPWRWRATTAVVLQASGRGCAGLQGSRRPPNDPRGERSRPCLHTMRQRRDQVAVEELLVLLVLLVLLLELEVAVAAAQPLLPVAVAVVLVRLWAVPRTHTTSWRQCGWIASNGGG
jgi:hypothetical protein